MKKATETAHTKTAGGGGVTSLQRIAQLEAENAKLRDIIAQMVCVAQAVGDLAPRHQPVHPQQGGPVHVIDGGVLGNGSSQIDRLGPDVSQQVS